MKPLSKKLRTHVLWILLFIFFTCTPVLIGYSKGYRVDDALGIIQTGGIYLHSNIAYTQVFIDDEFVESNGALLRNTFVEGLLPNRYYVVRVQREGYQSWVKMLHVEPRLVTEAKVFMLPVKFEWKTIEATSTLSFIDEGSGISTSSEVVNPEYKERLDLFAKVENQFEVDIATSSYEYIRGVRSPTTTIVTEIRFPEWLAELASSSELQNKEMVREREGIVTWLENGNLYAVWAREDDTTPYYFCSENQCNKQLAIQWEDYIEHYDFFPNRNDMVVLQTARGIYAVELDNRSQRNIQTIIEEDNLTFRIRTNDTIVIFNGTTFRDAEL